MVSDTCSIIYLYTFFVINWSPLEMSHDGRSRYDTNIISAFSIYTVYFTR